MRDDVMVTTVTVMLFPGRDAITAVGMSVSVTVTVATPLRPAVLARSSNPFVLLFCSETRLESTSCTRESPVYATRVPLGYISVMDTLVDVGSPSADAVSAVAAKRRCVMDTSIDEGSSRTTSTACLVNNAVFRQLPGSIKAVNVAFPLASAVATLASDRTARTAALLELMMRPSARDRTVRPPSVECSTATRPSCWPGDRRTVASWSADATNLP
mmetsp:Transcript_11386/g.34293  ORF Transcript_11386/g.34293 Transcript_11386/m.34293 type:complete len:215 (+) Transcript_11386:10504-11148(+)